MCDYKTVLNQLQLKFFSQDIAASRGGISSQKYPVFRSLRQVLRRLIKIEAGQLHVQIYCHIWADGCISVRKMRLIPKVKPLMDRSKISEDKFTFTLLRFTRIKEAVGKATHTNKSAARATTWEP